MLSNPAKQWHVYLWGSLACAAAYHGTVYQGFYLILAVIVLVLGAVGDYKRNE